MKYFIVSILIFPIFLLAQESDEQETFKYTYGLCAPLNSQEADFIGARNHIFETVKNGYLSVVTINLRELPISKNIRLLMANPGYERALQKCFGTSKIDRYAFSMTLVADDLAGKALGVATWVGVYFVFKKLYVSRWAKAHPTFMKVSMGALTALGVSGLALQYLDMEQKVDAIEAIKKNPKLLLNKELNQEIYDESIRRVRERLRVVNEEIDSGTASPARLMYLTIKKQELEERLRVQIKLEAGSQADVLQH